MKRLIFIVVFFLVSVISFGQTNFMTENFSQTYTCNQMRYATYKFSTKETFITSIKSFNDYTENVIYNYYKKEFVIYANGNSNLIDNAYVECFDAEVVKRYFVYQKITVNNTTIYGLVAIVNYFDSTSKTSHITYISKVIP